jgi:hypothetical protein
LKALRALALIVLLVALVMAIGHARFAVGVSFLFRPAGRPPPSSSSGRNAGAFPFFVIGVYFLFAMIVYILGGILVAAGKLFKLANIGLIIMAIVDNILLIYTRVMPNIFFSRMIPWSYQWFPPGTVQILIGQTIIIVLCAVMLYKRK